MNHNSPHIVAENVPIINISNANRMEKPTEKRTGGPRKKEREEESETMRDTDTAGRVNGKWLKSSVKESG